MVVKCRHYLLNQQKGNDLATIREKKITVADFERLSAPMEGDLIALFKLMEEAAFDLIAKADKEAWSNDKLLKEMGKLISKGTR